MVAEGSVQMPVMATGGKERNVCNFLPGEDHRVLFAVQEKYPLAQYQQRSGWS